MTDRSWDTVLGEIEHTLDEVERALAEGRPVPHLPDFDPPHGELPPLQARQRRWAQSLMQRQSLVTARLASSIEGIHEDLGDLRRRRRAAVAYVRGG